MKIEEALKLIDNVCANVSMPRESHVQIQIANQLIKAQCDKVPGLEKKLEGKEETK